MTAVISIAFSKGNNYTTAKCFRNWLIYNIIFNKDGKNINKRKERKRDL